MVTCHECKKEVESYAWSDYCDDCADAAWDRSFEGSSENAYEIAFRNLHDKLGKKCNNDTIHAMKEIIREWGPLQWKCPKCSEVVMSKELSSQLDVDEKVKRLCTPCTCGTYPVPEHPDKYY